MDVIKIAIKSSSGFCSFDDAYNDKLTITPNSISYECKPVSPFQINTKNNVKWSYKTTNPKFKNLYSQIVPLALDIVNSSEFVEVLDIGETEFIIYYADKSKTERLFFTPKNYFRDCFDLIKKMIPNCEHIPKVL